MPVTRNLAKEVYGRLIAADPEIERRLHQRIREARAKEQAEQRAAQRMAEQQDQNQQDQNPPEIKLRDRAIPNANDFRSSIAAPQVNIQNYELKPGLIQMVQQSQFGGSHMENPNVHLQKFLQLCNTVKMNGVSADIIRLQLFPFSLRDKAMEWLMSMPADSITTWDGLSKAFLSRYFPPSKTAKIRQELNTFSQKDGESLYEAWERNKDLQRQCPHHGIPEWLVIENFYNGLDQSIRSALDSAAGGSLMGKSDAQARQLIEEMALHNYQYGNPRGRQRGMFEMEAIQMLTAKLDQIATKVNQVASSNVNCGACGMMGHQTAECLNSSQDSSIQEVNAFNQRPSGNPYSNTFNSGWRNNPNFSWSNNQPQNMQNQNRPPGFVPRNPIPQNPSMQTMPPQPQKSRVEELLEQMIVTQQKKDFDNEQKFQQIFNKFDQMQAHNKMLESQIAQMSAGSSQKNYGKLPSQPEINPREGVNAITLRSGKQLSKPEPVGEKEEKEEQNPEPKEEVSRGKSIEIHENVEEEKQYVSPPPYQPPIPFP